VASLHDPPFRADHVGSLRRPQSLVDARSRYRKKEIGRDELARAEDAAIREVVALQESLGLKSITDRADLIDDPRFASVAARVKNSNDWYRLREETVAQGTTAHWLKLFAELDIPAMPCHALGTIADDPHLAAVGLVERSVHPTEGPVKSVRPTLMFDGEPVRSESQAQPLGADTRKVLAESGYSDAEIDALIGSGAAVEGRG
jgi:crotonobetainyl-CoA:carnitine CoA-transferase CaiB-like acyl-CoA transferase